jgi:hypothetical protein
MERTKEVIDYRITRLKAVLQRLRAERRVALLAQRHRELVRAGKGGGRSNGK